jgi:hypothetical protein
MEMKRRHFFKLTLGALLGPPLLWVADRVAPVRYTEALRARFYPGGVRALDRSSVRRPGKWAG